jgi:hypothetical protein
MGRLRLSLIFPSNKIVISAVVAVNAYVNSPLRNISEIFQQCRKTPVFVSEEAPWW